MGQIKSHYFNFFIISASILLLVVMFNTNAFSVDTCIDCHKDNKFRVQNISLFEYYENWKDSDHDIAGIVCSDCHGGDPSKEKKEEAHAKNLSVNNEKSMVHYKNIPNTCGKCHEKVYKQFIESKHFKELIKIGVGPSCLTCHGNPLENIYRTSTVIRTCKGCHNFQTKNRPEIIGEANRILRRINMSRGFLKWTSRHSEDISKPERLKRVKVLYQHVSDSWHQYNIANSDKNSEKLLSELKDILIEYRKSRKE